MTNLKAMRRLSFTTVIVVLLAGFTNCSKVFFDGKSSGAQDIIVGNPLNPANGAVSKIADAICSVINRCEGVTFNDCANGLQTVSGVDKRLGLSTQNYDPFSNLEAAQVNSVIQSDAEATTACVSAITALSCDDPAVLAAYDRLSSNPFAGVPGLIPAQPGPCDGVYSAVASKVFLVGGYNGGTPMSDILLSADGSPWRSTGSAFPFGPIESVQILSVNASLYAIGGDGGRPSQAMGSVYKSIDGISWSAIGALPAGEKRTEGVALYYQNKLWYLGGDDGNAITASVLTSPDGVSWTDMGAILPRAMVDFSGTVYQNKMWIAGGTDWNHNFADVYNSVDGTTWNHIGFLPLAVNRGSLTVYQGAMWWAGGMPGSNSNAQIWTSVDGITWSPVGRQTLPAGPDYGHSMVVFGNQLLFATGYSGGGGTFTSADGISWSPVNSFLTEFRTYVGVGLLP